MGASLDTPAQCSLCDELTGDPVTLKCNHRFCRRCIGDLWSVTPQGPYHCPEWNCKTVYQTLPFDSSLTRPPTDSQRARPRSTAGTSRSDEQSSSDSLLRRPSLTSRLLGKRRASTPVSEEREAKRSMAEAPLEHSRDTETPSTSSSGIPKQSTDVEQTKEVVHPESTQSEHGDGTSSDDNSDSRAAAAAANDAQSDIISIQQNQHKPMEVIALEDSDTSNEVDICDAPLLTTPKKEAAGRLTSPKKPASPANWASSPGGVSTPDGSPAHHVSKTHLILNKRPAAADPGSQSRVFIHSRSESNNVPCHYCPKAVCQSAVKTCLVCGASMCSEHLRPHLDSPVFQNHTLVPPVEDISTWRCQEHHEINRIYCQQCSVCVCTVCTVIGSHRNHACVSIREAERELRGNLKDEIKQLQGAEEEVRNRVTELTHMKETFTGVLSEARAEVQQQYGAIREALEQEEQTTLNCVTKEESRVLGGLEEKLGNLQSSLQSIQKGLHTLEGLADAKGDKRIQDQAFIMEYSRVAKLNIGSGLDQFEAPEVVDRPRLKCLKSWTEKRLDTVVITLPGKDVDLYRLLYGTALVLDADTAHPKLQLSDNDRRVTYSEAQQAYTEQEARFSSFPQVLATCALEGARWYWEVDVSVDEGRWKVGLCEGQIERKGQKDNSRLGFNSYSWCLACDKRKVEALHNKVAVTVDADGLQRVGVFLDFEEGILSFFNVTPGGSLALMHSFKHNFTDPLYPAFSVSKTHLAICDLFQS